MAQFRGISAWIEFCYIIFIVDIYQKNMKMSFGNGSLCIGSNKTDNKWTTHTNTTFCKTKHSRNFKNKRMNILKLVKVYDKLKHRNLKNYAIKFLCLEIRSLPKLIWELHTLYFFQRVLIKIYVDLFWYRLYPTEIQWTF